MISRIEDIERRFRHNGNGQFSLNDFSLNIPGDDNIKLQAVTCRPGNGFRGYFMEDRFPKERVVLHFTMGNIFSDAVALTKQRVSVPFLIARDGSIYNLFSSRAWSWHLGLGAVGKAPDGRNNTYYSQRSVGIELSNYGPLTRVGNNLETYYSRRGGGPVQIYCSIDDKEHYHELPEGYRGFKYFASYTSAQYESLIILLRYLTATYDIPREFLDPASRYATSDDAADFKGIVSHVNYRTDKVDLPPVPAFDWDRVIKGVKARKYGELTPLEEAELAYEKAKEEAETAVVRIVDVKREVEMAKASFEAAQLELEVATKQAETLKRAEAAAGQRLAAIREGRPVPSELEETNGDMIGAGDTSDTMGIEGEWGDEADKS
jgi:N-acetyl-anhydromuramyl-L-alanine amidase AmpD